MSDLTNISGLIIKAMRHFEEMGAEGEDLRLARSKSLTFESRSYSRDLTTFQGTIKGRDGIYNPRIVIGKGYTCDCTDQKNKLDGTRKKGQHTGDNYAKSPCKHNLALARQSWVAMRSLLGQVSILTDIAMALSDKEDGDKRKSA